MRRWRSLVLAGLLVLAAAPAAGAQDLGELFRNINASVVVVRGKGREVTAARGVSTFNETGSGVLISADGKVITAAHVVHAMDDISVVFPGGETVSARVVASEPAAADLSLLQLDRVPPGATVSPMADSNTVRAGDGIVVVGAPYRLPHSVSVGSISARWAPNTAYPAMPLAEFLQTDATIDAGNSGGPMFNMRGEVIGIVNDNISRGQGRTRPGLVVTSNTAKQLLFEKRSLWSGVEGIVLSDQLADLLNLPPRANGYMVKTVAKGSSADQIGLRGSTETKNISGQTVPLGDIILSVEGISPAPANLGKIRDVMGRLAPGTPFRVTILREGRVLELTGQIP